MVFRGQPSVLGCLEGLAKRALANAELAGHLGLDQSLSGPKLTLEDRLERLFCNLGGEVAAFFKFNHRVRYSIKECEMSSGR